MTRTGNTLNKPKPLRPDRLRTIEKPFCWLPFRLLKDGTLACLSDRAKLLYLFLCLAANRQGLSYYSDKRIQANFELNSNDIELARNELIKKDLIAHNGRVYQLLSLPSAGPQSVNSSQQTTSNSPTMLPYSEPQSNYAEPEPLSDVLKRFAEKFC